MSAWKEGWAAQAQERESARVAEETRRWEWALSRGAQPFVALFLGRVQGGEQSETDERECWLAQKRGVLSSSLAGELARFESIEEGRFAMPYVNVVGDHEGDWELEKLGLAAGVGVYVNVWEERDGKEGARLHRIRDALGWMESKGLAQGPVRLDFREDRRRYQEDVFRVCLALRERQEMRAEIEPGAPERLGGAARL